jgi:hypothetical protein
MLLVLYVKLNQVDYAKVVTARCLIGITLDAMHTQNGNVSMTLEKILAAEIERLEKNYGYRNRFILIGLGDGGHLTMCTTPMTETSKEHMLDAAKRLP